MSEYTSSTGAVVAVVPTATGPVEIDKAAGTLVPTSGPNRILPPLNPFMARSTIAAAIGILQTLLPLLGDGGLAELAGEAIKSEDTIQANVEAALRALDVLIGVGSWVWYGLERRAPNFRLSFRSY